MTEVETLEEPAQKETHYADASGTRYRWSRIRWIATIGGFLLFQLLFLYVVMDRPLNESNLRGPRIVARMMSKPLTEEWFSQNIFSSDPLLFPLASQHGFSQQGWMTVNRPNYVLPDEIEPPHWLALRTERLGLVPPSEQKSELPFELGQQSTPQTEALPVFVSAVVPRTNSVVRVDKKLSERAIGLPYSLPTRSSAEILDKSVIEIAVNGAGEVIARRVASSSGSKQADKDALQKAKLLRFRPLNAIGTIWGQAIFDWETAEAKSEK
jgi:TonB family protein